MAYSLSGLLTACGRSAEQRRLEATTIGLALPLLAEGSPSATQTLAWHTERLLAGLRSQHVGLCFDRFGQLCGFVQWAHVTTEVSCLLLKSGPTALTPALLHSGEETWILESFVRQGELPLVLHSLRDVWLKTVPSVTYFRLKNGRCMIKRLSRTSSASFLRPAAPTVLEGGGASEHRLEGRFLHSADTLLTHAVELGEVALLAGPTTTLGQLPLPHALARLKAPMNQLQRRLYRDGNGQLVGYVSWAWMTADALAGAVPKFHQMAGYQWNEGQHLLLCDAIASPGSAAVVANDLASGLLASEPTWVRSPVARQLCAKDVAALHVDANGLQTLDLARHLQLAAGAPA